MISGVLAHTSAIGGLIQSTAVEEFNVSSLENLENWIFIALILTFRFYPSKDYYYMGQQFLFMTEPRRS